MTSESVVMLTSATMSLHTGAYRRRGDVGRYGEIWACRRRRSSCLGRCGEMWGDVGRCGETRACCRRRSSCLHRLRKLSCLPGGASCRERREAPIRTGDVGRYGEIWGDRLVQEGEGGSHQDADEGDDDPHQLLCGQAPAERAAAGGA